MKKIISLMIAVIMAFSVATVTSVCAFAAVQSPESTTATVSKAGEVNGKTSTDVTYTTNSTDPTKITFTYTGDGELTGWEFPGMVEGQNYQIVSQNENTVVIQLINNYNGNVVGNALVKDASASKTTTTKKVTTTAKKSNSSSSPDTGASVGAGVALMGAGVAVLVVLKKKNAE